MPPADSRPEKDTPQSAHAPEEALRQLQKAESIGQLTCGIVHDFNNSLQNIVSSLELVRKLIGTGRAAEAERFISIAINTAQGAASANQRLLALSRQQPPAPGPVTINQLISGMEEMLRRSVAHSVKLKIDLAPDLWETHCDANAAEHAILNLVLNARAAIPEGETITIQTGNAEVDGGQHAAGITPGQYICISVTDTGTGMSPEVIRHAFDAFFSGKPNGTGIGLGLTMVRRFARQYKGDVEIRSEAGRGTSIRLYLPRYPRAAPG